MSETSLFSPRILLIWVGALAAIFALSIYLMAFGIGAPETQTIGPNAYSRSAIGYAGLAELLRRVDIPVIRKRVGTGGDEDKASLLIIAEPDVAADRKRAASRSAAGERSGDPAQMGGRARREDHEGWVSRVDPAPQANADWALSVLGLDGHIARGTQDAPLDKTLTLNALALAPTLPADVQLIVKSSLTPILATPAGLLVGQKILRGHRVWIVSDPDILSNHGLFEGANAAFAGALIEALRGPGGAVIFDETVHGSAAPAANPLRALFQFPFVIAVAYALAALLVVLWSAFGRMGPPEASPLALKAGKLGLIRNVADLIQFAGGRQDVAINYLRMTVEDAARRLRAPKGLAPERQMEWLDRVGQARGVKIKVAEIAQKLIGQRQDAGLSRAALDLHLWKQEILRGP